MGVRELLASNNLLRTATNGVTSPQIQERKDSSHRTLPTHARRLISVIIPAHNEEAYLRRTLNALRRQKHVRREIIVVANGCTDRTAEIARGRCDRLVVLSQRGLGVARNLGARMARGELLVFLDADTLLDRRALSRVAEQFTGADAAGTLKGRPDSNRLAYRLIYFLKNLNHRDLTRNGSSGVILCWKKDFVRLGGFDEGLEVRENSQLIRRLKRFGKYRYIANAVAVTSMRRYDRHGIRRVTWLWVKLWFRSLFRDLHAHHYEPVR
jgi:glycosyltransferase involved in cell wall biosynthesis